MRAARLHAYGGPEVLRVDDDVPEPTPGAGEVLVEVHASSVNPIDTKIRKGAFRAAIRYRLPRTLGLDLSGVVRAVGPGVAGFAPGDEVYASPSHERSGAYAELATVAASALAKKPPSLSHQEAASLPLVFLTAWQALVESAKLEAGERVLVQAGAGGVGTVAIQIAKHLGAHVATTCSARNAELVTSLGADRVVDYREERYTDVLEGYDVVLDALGPKEARAARSILGKGGRVVGLSAGLPERAARVGPLLGLLGTGLALGAHVVGARLHGVRTRFITRRPDGAQLDTLTALVEAGALRPVIDTVYPLADVAEAHRHSETGRARGKLVIAVR